MRHLVLKILCTIPVICSEIANAQLPDAANRSYAQNYKDKVLAACIATAYKGTKDVSRDATYTASALNEWGRYDIDGSTGKMEEIISQFLSRPYHSIHSEEVHLNLLKCIDLYHSKELEAQVKLYVSNPTGSFLKDNPHVNR